MFHWVQKWKSAQINNKSKMSEKSGAPWGKGGIRWHQKKAKKTVAKMYKAQIINIKPNYSETLGGMH